MNIDDMTVKQLREIHQLMVAPQATITDVFPFKAGDAVFLRTVTMHYTGRIAAIDLHTIVLTDAAWIADSGRFGTALASGTLNEVEPFPGPVAVGRGALIDCCTWAHSLPRTQQ